MTIRTSPTLPGMVVGLTIALMASAAHAQEAPIWRSTLSAHVAT